MAANSSSQSRSQVIVWRPVSCFGCPLEPAGQLLASNSRWRWQRTANNSKAAAATTAAEDKYGEKRKKQQQLHFSCAIPNGRQQGLHLKKNTDIKQKIYTNIIGTLFKTVLKSNLIFKH